MDNVNWVGLLSIAVSLLVVGSGFVLRNFYALRGEVAELKVDHQRLLGSIAEKYVRSPEFAEFKSLMRSEFQAMRQEFSASQQDFKLMASAFHELKGAVSATNNQRG